MPFHDPRSPGRASRALQGSVPLEKYKRGQHGPWLLSQCPVHPTGQVSPARGVHLLRPFILLYAAARKLERPPPPGSPALACWAMCSCARGIDFCGPGKWAEEDSQPVALELQSGWPEHPRPWATTCSQPLHCNEVPVPLLCGPLPRSPSPTAFSKVNSCSMIPSPLPCFTLPFKQLLHLTCFMCASSCPSLEFSCLLHPSEPLCLRA